MDFTFSEDQLAVGKMARELLERHATTDRLTELEAAGTHDRECCLQRRRSVGDRDAAHTRQTARRPQGVELSREEEHERF